VNENIIAINIPNAVSILVMAALGGLVFAFARKAIGGKPNVAFAPGSDAPGR